MSSFQSGMMLGMMAESFGSRGAPARQPAGGGSSILGGGQEQEVLGARGRRPSAGATPTGRTAEERPEAPPTPVPEFPTSRGAPGHAPPGPANEPGTAPGRETQEPAPAPEAPTGETPQPPTADAGANAAAAQRASQRRRSRAGGVRRSLLDPTQAGIKAMLEAMTLLGG